MLESDCRRGIAWVLTVEEPPVVTEIWARTQNVGEIVGDAVSMWVGKKSCYDYETNSCVGGEWVGEKSCYDYDWNS